MRFHGPLEGSYQAAILEEMASSTEIGVIHDVIEREIRLGALEVKGAWSKGATVVGARLLAAISRSVTHAMTWLGAEFAIAAVSDALMPVGDVTGGVQVGTQWVPFPDERYRTVAVSWHRARSYELSSPSNQQALRRESEQLLRGPARLGLGPIEPASTRTRAARPLVLDVGERAQREVLRILREDSALQIIDRLAEQREQLGEIIPPPASPSLKRVRDGCTTRGAVPWCDSSLPGRSRRFVWTEIATR